MSPKPAIRVTEVLTKVAAQHHMHVSPGQLRILAGSACAELALADAAVVDRPLLVQFMTDNQLMLLKLMANGLTNEQMAAVTCRSINTIKTQVRRILDRLGAHDRGHAVAIALARRFLDPADIDLPQGRPRKRPGRKPRSEAVA